MKKSKEKPVEAKKKKAEKYYYAVGRRKVSVAQIRLYAQKDLKENEMLVNDKTLNEYTPLKELRTVILEAFELTGQTKGFRTTVRVRGGGIRGQAEAIRLGIARALVEYDENIRPVLKSAGFLTRDAREVERKKPGLKKARRAPQWSKR